MAETTKYRLWLKFRVGKSLGTEDSALTASIAGRTVTIESETRGEPLSKTSWLVMNCRGFETEAQAREFGEELRRATHLAGLCNRVGVDARDPGEDRTVSWFNPEVFRSVDPDERLAPDVHGIVVLPDDGNNVFVRGRANPQVLANAGHFARSLEECLAENDPLRSGSPSIRRAIRVLSLAEINEDPIAKLVLAVSTIEGLATDPPWTDEHQGFIDSAAACLKRAHGDREEAMQVVEAIRQIRKESIRQRIRKLLEANDLSHVWRDWDSLYGRRSPRAGGDQAVRTNRPLDGEATRDRSSRPCQGEFRSRLGRSGPPAPAWSVGSACTRLLERIARTGAGWKSVNGFDGSVDSRSQ